MLDYSKILSLEPFSLARNEKELWYLQRQKVLSNFHYSNCLPYKNIVDKLEIKIADINTLSQIPMLSAKIFKQLDLRSHSEHETTVTLTSSGTSGSEVSKIRLDKRTALLQSRVLKRIFSTIFPTKEGTVFFVEQKSELKTAVVSARKAAVRGFSQFFSDTHYLLDEKSELTIEALYEFVKNKPTEPFVIFGFTSTIWLKLVKELRKLNIRLPLNKGVVLHGGGWKKINEQAVSKEEFNTTLKTNLGVSSVHNYYGMVEQTGSVFLECEHGFFHPSVFSDIIIRNSNLEPTGFNEEGLIQVLSLLPQSYPGHSILTDDIGSLVGEDDCQCLRKGKYFIVKGRVAGADLRGCSDVY